VSARIVESWSLPGVRAGSGLAWWGRSLIAVQDDAFSAVRIDPETRRTAPIVLEGHGQALPKSEKPDFEAIAPDARGRLWLFGSGSAEKRRRMAILDPETGMVGLSDAGAVYDAVAQAIGGTPNIEGAVFVGEGLRLFHRGAGDAPSITVDVACDPARGPLPCVVATTVYDLGRVGMVPLTFTDATAYQSGVIAYLAVAEDTPNAIDDGPVVGAAIGFLSANGASWSPIMEADGTPSVRKFEGIALSPEGDSAWLITDADDPTKPAELCRLAIEL
jgi:hypothetical protein